MSKKNVSGKQQVKTQDEKFEDAVNEVATTILPTRNAGYGPIEKSVWEKAQIAEREQHKLGYTEGLLHYAASYSNYFHFVGLGKDLGGMRIIEIGPADFPALYFCTNYVGVIIEPMPSEHLEKLAAEKVVKLIREPFETVTEDQLADDKNYPLTEIWLFNVMQHIIDPDTFIEKCKAIAQRIRFFEPIDQPVTEYHPQSYTANDYTKWFGGQSCMNIYSGGSVPGFHTANCVYGVYHV